MARPPLSRRPFSTTPTGFREVPVSQLASGGGAGVRASGTAIPNLRTCSTDNRSEKKLAEHRTPPIILCNRFAHCRQPQMKDRPLTVDITVNNSPLKDVSLDK